jgi:hypothetical protein
MTPRRYLLGELPSEGTRTEAQRGLDGGARRRSSISTVAWTSVSLDTGWALPGSCTFSVRNHLHEVDRAGRVHSIGGWQTVLGQVGWTREPAFPTLRLLNVGLER